MEQSPDNSEDSQANDVANSDQDGLEQNLDNSLEESTEEAAEPEFNLAEMEHVIFKVNGHRLKPYYDLPSSSFDGIEEIKLEEPSYDHL